LGLENAAGEIIKCACCGKPVSENCFWVVMRFEKEDFKFPCPECGKEIILKYHFKTCMYEFDKTCSCKIKFKDELLETAKQDKWNRKKYIFCDDCFKKKFSNPILYSELGEDEIRLT